MRNTDQSVFLCRYSSTDCEVANSIKLILETMISARLSFFAYFNKR